jgi:hypothetical protein
MQMRRRHFLKTGVLGAIVLAFGGATCRALQSSASPSSAPRFVLDPDARAVLAAIVPAMLGSALPALGAPRSKAIAAAIDSVEQTIARLPLATRKEVQELFALMALGFVRRLVAGVEGNWADAGVAPVTAFLQRWRLHRFALLQTAYHALHDLILGSWYAESAHWAAIGYPGPMPELA